MSTGQLLNTLLLVLGLGVEGHADADARVVLDGAALLLVRVLGVHAAVGAALDDEAAVAGGHELLEDGGELLGDLLEGAFDGLVLALVQMRHELLDRLLRLVQLLASLEEAVLLRREAVVLVQRLLVDVLVLLERLLDLHESRRSL